MPSPIVHFQVMSANPEATAKFFSDVFDWETEPGRGGANLSLNTGAAQVVPNDIFVNGTLREAPAGTPPAFMVYVRVADLDGTLVKAVQHGGAVVMPRRDMQGAPTIAIVKAPDGLVVGVVQL